MCSWGLKKLMCSVPETKAYIKIGKHKYKTERTFKKKKKSGSTYTAVANDIPYKYPLEI